LKQKVKHKGIWILVAAFLLVLAGGVFTAVFPDRVPVLTQIVGTVTAPIQRGTAAAARWLNGIYSYTYKFDAIQRENEELKIRLAEMEEKVRAAEASERENERLRKLIGLQERRKDFVFESASVTSRGSSNWASTLTISKGTASGVEKNDCVITASGYLVGVVAEAGYNWSTVITVVDTDIELGGMIYRTEELCMVEGAFDLMSQGRMKLSYFSEDSELMRGDVVVTSGLGGVYPSGLPIGRVEDVRMDASGVSRFAVLAPMADLSDLTQVFVIKEFMIEE
jgi:rod shape-determining protein MreC